MTSDEPPPKRLVILRHAKTEKLNLGGDHARQLTSRGHRNAAEMGALIGDLIGQPDAIVTSDAARALETTEAIAGALGIAPEPDVRPEMYASSLNTLLEIIKTLNPAFKTVVLVGHNPEFHELILWLGGNEEGYDHLPPAGFAIVELDGQRWSDISPDTSHVSTIYVPTRKSKL